MNRKLRTVFCGMASFVAIIVGAGESLGAIITLEPVADASQYRQVQPGFPTQTQLIHTNPALSAKLDGEINNLGTTTFAFQFAMEFDITAASTAGSIAKGILQWSETTDQILGPNTHPLKGYQGNGAIASADFSTSLVTSPLGQVADGIVESTYSTDVTAFLNDLLANDANYAGFRVENNNPFSEPSGSSTHLTIGEYAIYSRLAANSALRPNLILTTIPECDSLTLIGLGAILISSWNLIGRGRN